MRHFTVFTSLASAFLLLAPTARAAAPAPAPKASRPNILFILVDDMGYGDLGILYQNHKSGRRMKTPNLDRMAAQGAILSHHCCPAPVCAPSRASLLLGVHQGHSNVRDNQFDKGLADNHTLATTLRTLGYTTALVGKYGLQGGRQGKGRHPDGKKLWNAYPTMRGFDSFFGYVRHGDGHNHYPAHNTASRPKKEVWDNERMVRDELQFCYTADLWTARAKKFIVDQTKAHPDKPFFLMLCYDTPHAALQLPTMAFPKGGGLDGGIQWLGKPGHMINTASGKIDSWRHPDYTGKGWSDLDERFATSVRRIDDCVGDLRKTLEDLGIAKNTFVVFTSDNGPHRESYFRPKQTRDGIPYKPTAFQSYGPFEGIKRDVWEGGIREPAFVWGPDIVGGATGSLEHPRTIATPSQFQDWMPTLVELAGGVPPCRTDGVSLLPEITGNAKRVREGTVYVEYKVGGTTPRYKDFKNHGGAKRSQMQVILVKGTDDVWYKGVRTNITRSDDPFHIYRIDDDPKEAKDLAGTSPFFDALGKEMLARIVQIRQPNPSAPRPYDKELAPAVKPKQDPAPGLEVASYEGDWPWLPEFRDMKPVATGVAKTISAAPLSRPANAGLLFTGFIKIPKDGVWKFRIDSDTGAALRIHESQVVDDDFAHGTPDSATGTMHLAAGLHPIRLYYRSGAAKPRLSLQWAGPDKGKFAPVPDSAFMRPAN